MFISRASQTSIKFNLLIFRRSLNINCVCYSEMNMNAGNFTIIVALKPLAVKRFELQ